ncbi:class I SAM-dependent methyltransferase [Chenggangzhangella methanolivorans]|uniref:Class I SAM-dependent methyltransferase n=1 Tax=Chenggangzhangella methanolivorans TaxID=1437009 RepID=A0A9E6R8L5_9HYPH|nr:class I SAM-dependent methyltransferase [Chenggangzhangella methanolivorans]QZN98617.1 class I SAM-dependent methyltransferase [Chenggangzhangella methanolivorans]
MSGFDPDWLDLREPADHRSLANEPLERIAALFAGRETVSVTDLGAGSGSLLRALSPRLGPKQRWTLVDADEGLLAHARTRLSKWADASSDAGGRLLLQKTATEIEVMTLARDLSADPLPAAAAEADLVTASAFFDLAGHDWTEAFVSRLAASGKPLYAPLVYAGEKRFSPAHRLDAAALEAFNRHQLRDKGLGPAMGPGAALGLAEIGRAAGLACLSSPSPWRLDEADEALTRRLASDMAQAIAELPDGPELGEWLAFRLEHAASGVGVAHEDLLLQPG